MSRLRSSLALSFLVAAVALGACKKTGSPPTGYGVNVTIDATMLSAGDRAKITAVMLTVVDDTKMGSTPVKHSLEVLKQIQGGKVTFTYTPGADVDMTDTLELGVDAMNGTTLVASGSSGKVPLKANAVEALIMLAGLGDGGTGDGSGKSNGTACVTGDECGSTFCTDGVCCNEKCDDVCVSCNQTASKGICTPYAVNTDPEMECAAKIPMAPPPDDGGTTTDASVDVAASEAGTSEAGVSEAGTSEAGADASPDADDSDALILNTPDGGFTTMPNACAGTCGGARSCNYPDKTKSCGTPFCNSRKDVASFVCNGNGGCSPSISACTDYVCDDSSAACLTRCSAHSDCQLNDYCDGTSHTCVPKNDLGLSCTADANCRSGNCAIPLNATTGVCCNTACSTAPLTCNNSGSVGQCKCAECTTGPCQIFYPDADGDGYGDINATYGHGAVAGCMNVPPARFVADNTDCDDGDVNVHPGQVGFFGTPSKGIGTFDYNCDKNMEKQTPEYPFGVCRFCGPTTNCAATTTSCSSTSQTESFQCPQEGTRPIYEEPVSTLSSNLSGDGAPAFTSRALTPIVPIMPVYSFCCGCAPRDKSGFTVAVKCGDFANVITCGGCNGSSATGASATRTQQLCR